MTRTTPGTRRTWSTGQQWVAHLRDLVRRLGTRGRYDTDLQAHLVACDREFLRSRSCPELYAIRRAFEDPKIHHRVCPPRGARAGSPYVLIVDEIHNALQNVRAKDRRRQQFFHEQTLLAARRVQLRLPFDVDVAHQEAA